MSLETPNRDAAATRAKEIYLFLHAIGWQAALARYRPKAAVLLTNATIGEFLDRVEQRADLDPGTFADYARALRKIVADIIGHSADSRKFGYHGWKRAFLADNNGDEKARRHAKVSVNSFLRRARSLFSEKVLRHLEITCTNPFQSVEFQVAAREELSELDPDVFKVFLLAALAGLRRGEIDTLTWAAFRWNERTIRIGPMKKLLLILDFACHGRLLHKPVLNPTLPIRLGRRHGLQQLEIERQKLAL